MGGANIDAAHVLAEGRSPQSWLVLGLVIERPSHGYEIAQRYEDRFGWLLPISGSSIYAALERLRSDGLLEEVVEEEPFDDARSRGRRCLRATRAGAQAYRRWLAGRMRDNPQRFELLGRLASTTVLGVRGALDVLERFEQECVRDMKGLPLLDERVGAGECDAGELAHWLAVDRQRRALRADLDWAADARKTVLLYAGHREGDTGQDQ
jgi:DNA-binding PadR family transcriptional regulator